MGLIYAISVLVFVCVIASVYSNEVTRPYLTTKVVVQRITNHKEYRSKEYRDSRIITNYRFNSM